MHHSLTTTTAPSTLAFTAPASPLVFTHNTTTRLSPSTLTTMTLSSPPSRAAARPVVVSRRLFLTCMGGAALGHLLLNDGLVSPAVADDATTGTTLNLTTTTQGNGPTPVVGDLVGIRFKGSYNGVVFDNLFESTQPYFYRVGTGSVLVGIDEAVQQMKVGQVADVTLLPDKAFGTKGRRASPGKPAIPPNATVSYTIELSTIPGKDEELLEGLDDADIGTSL